MRQTPASPAAQAAEFVRPRDGVETFVRALEGVPTGLETVVDQLPIGLAVAEVPSGRLLFANRVWRELFAQPAGAEDVDAYGTVVAVRPDGREYAPEEHPLARSVRTGEVVVAEQIELTRPDGSRAVVEVNSAPIRNADGEITSAAATLSDSSARRRAETLLDGHRRVLELVAAEAPLEESLSELVRTIEEHADGEILGSVLLMDPESEHLRYGAAPSLPSSYKDVVDGIPVGPAVGSCGSAAYSGEPVVVTDIETDPRWDGYRELVRPLGLRACWSTPILSTRGEVLGTFAMYHRSAVPPRPRDEELVRIAVRTAAVAIEQTRLQQERASLLEREREARKQAESRAQAAISLAYIGDGVCLLDANGIVRLWNPTAERILGIPAESIVGRSLLEAIPGWQAVSDQARAAHEEAVSVTIPLERSGTEAWLSLSVVAFDGGTVYAFRDVTSEREQAAVRADIVATVSHELRTPLAGVYGAAKTLRRIDPGSQHAVPLVGLIEREAERLRILIEEILLTSQLESGARIDFDIRSVDVGALARSVVDAMQPSAAGAIRLEAPAGPISAKSDEQRLRQVLTNLVDNAVKYAGSDGEIVVAVERLDSSVRVRVIDRGPGIPGERQEHIFEKYYRLDPALTQGVGGTGLGLYICRKLVERMRGRIWVESREGEGATFVVELPLPAHSDDPVFGSARSGYDRGDGTSLG